MRTDDLDYDLPHSAIAQTPVEPRDSARLLTYLGGVVAHRHVSDLADLVRPGDVLVVNDTKVLPARLRLTKATGGVVEVLLLERDPSGWWRALVRPSRKIAAGTVLRSPGSDLGVEVGEVLAEGQRRVRLLGPDDLALSPLDEPVALDAHGVMPLPIHHHGHDRSGAVSNSVRPPARIRGGPHRGAAFHRGPHGTVPRPWGPGAVRGTGGGARHVPSGDH